jgi:glycosyltransferase involved in cell wall biosynthesis
MWRDRLTRFGSALGVGRVQLAASGPQAKGTMTVPSAPQEHGRRLQDRQMGARIALFLQTLSGGGAERMMLNIGRELVARGFSVDLIVVRHDGRYAGAVPAGVRLINFDCKRVSLGLLDLVRYLRRERPQAMLSTMVEPNVAAILARAVARVPTRVVVREANYDAVELEPEYRNLLKDRVANWLKRQVYRYADGIVAVSQRLADQVNAQVHPDPRRIHVIANPVVSETLLRQAAEPVDHPWLNEAGPPVVLGIGRLHMQKDFATLIRAVAQARQEREIRLILCGEGRQRPELEGLRDELGLADAVAFAGFVQNPYAYMARASLVALSSRWEGSPNVLVEAMACGTPVVSTNCPTGPDEILENGRYGRLVPVSDAAALSRAILDTLAEPSDPDRLHRRASAFTVARSTDRYLSVLLGEEAAAALSSAGALPRPAGQKRAG